ncbi:AsnC family protein [Amycolatopsis sp. WGS_07]
MAGGPAGAPGPVPSGPAAMPGNPAAAPNGAPGASGPHSPAQSGIPGPDPASLPGHSGPHPPPGHSGPHPPLPGTSGPHPPLPGISGAYPPAQTGIPAGPGVSGAYSPGPAQGPGVSGAYSPVQTGMPAPNVYNGQSGPYPAPDPAVSTWGVPQTASWARGDEPRPAAAPAKKGRIGETMQSQGLEGEQLSVQLLEVQDPADFLFGAAGYRLEDGERAVVVHTEITNRGPIPFASLPDNYLELVTDSGETVAKAPVSLTSRPPHKIGVQPGETLGGHTVYVLPTATRVVSVRWSPRPEPDERTLTWAVD